MIIIETVLCLLAVVMLVPVLVIFAQVLLALAPYRPREMPRVRRPTVAIVIPAHDEALMIVDTLRFIVPQLTAGDRLLVVADNCSDDTAQIAAAAGAEVIERKDPKRGGKGYALDFGVRYIECDPPEVVIIIDADCKVEAGAIERLACRCLETGRPVQGLYVMRSPPGAGLKTRIAEFSWVVKTRVRPMGYHRLGLPCQLMGTGMAFPWAGISAAALASGHIVEDLMLGINLTRYGTPPLFCPEATVTSVFPGSAEGMQGQRTRWEHGHLAVILSETPRMFLDALRRGDGAMFALALDLIVPPLALLLMLLLTVFAACAFYFLAVRVALPMLLASAALMLFGLAVLLSWGRYARQVISLGSLAYAPFYALWKVPLYLRFLVRRQIEWVRSKRDAD